MDLELVKNQTPWFYMTLELNPMGPHGLKPNQKLNLTRFKWFLKKGLGVIGLDRS
jgi:hypothetical protein